MLEVEGKNVSFHQMRKKRPCMLYNITQLACNRDTATVLVRAEECEMSELGICGNLCH